jgi:hypothetical protein
MSPERTQAIKDLQVVRNLLLLEHKTFHVEPSPDVVPIPLENLSHIALGLALVDGLLTLLKENT